MPLALYSDSCINVLSVEICSLFLQRLFHINIIKLIRLLLLKFFNSAISHPSKTSGLFFYKRMASIAFTIATPPAPQYIVTVSKFYIKIIYAYLNVTSYFPDHLSSSPVRNFASSLCYSTLISHEKHHIRNACRPTCIKALWSNRTQY
jgi:hypothetical protein